jgi:hypothetical protein
MVENNILFEKAISRCSLQSKMPTAFLKQAEASFAVL